jgi:hypothetical protein
VYVYDATTFDVLQKHRLPEVVHGAGGIAEHGGRFVVVGGLPPETPENYLYEYDENFRFLRRHVLASGYTQMGIQTAAWCRGHWWFGCYGKPQVVLRASAEFEFTGRWEFSAAFGLEGLPDGRFLVAEDKVEEGAHVGRVALAAEDAAQGLKRVAP